MEGSGERFLVEPDARPEVQERPVYRTERGFVLPPGIIPWSEYQKMQTRVMWHAEHALQQRVRKLEGTRERFVVSDDPKDRVEFELVRAAFRAETNDVARGIRSLLKDAGVHAVINGPSEQSLLAWQRKLPRFTVKCFPMFFSSDAGKKDADRMKPSPRVAECLMHFDMERRLHYLRWHDNVDLDVLSRAEMVGRGVYADREELNEAYARKDLVGVASVVGRHISQAILRFP